MIYSIIIFGILLILQSLDIITTIKILKNGGYEKTKLVKWLMDKFGVIQALIFSKLIIFIITICIYYFMPLTRIFLLYIIGLANIYYIWIIYSNVKVIKNQLKEKI